MLEWKLWQKHSADASKQSDFEAIKKLLERGRATRTNSKTVYQKKK